MEEINSFFQEINKEFNQLKHLTGDEEKLTEYVKTLFPIFREIPIFNVMITFAEDTPYMWGTDYPDNYLGLFFQFRYRYRNEVREWFENSEYENYGLCEIDWMSYSVYFRIDDLLAETV